MRSLIILSIVFMSGVVSGCNTIGGLGQDLSETGKALDKAAYWSQNQIQEIDGGSTSTSGSANNITPNNSQIVVQEPDTLRQY